MLSEKFVRKYMRQAKLVGEDNNPCYSRQLGTVLVKVYQDSQGRVDSRIISTGYNGPPKHTPHTDSAEYLENIVWPQLNAKEVGTALHNLNIRSTGEAVSAKDAVHYKRQFVDWAEGCKTCPRRLIGAGSGERTSLCSCQHAERNAITNSTEDLHGCYLFGWHGLACWECAGAIINAGIAKAFFVDDGSYAVHGSDYSFGVRWLFEKAGVEIDIKKPEYYLA